MQQWPSQSTQALNEFYGNPDLNRDGRPDIKWEVENLARIEPPFPMIWSWNHVPVKTISLHKRCARSFEEALKEIGDKISIQDLIKFQINRCGGAYNFRLMRGINRLSTHSWGCALDLAPELNGLGVKYDQKKNMIPFRVVEIFASHGIVWGGQFKSRPDCMHFQAANI